MRIDDFADPQFSPEVRAMLAAIEPMAEEVDLRPGPLMDLARAETGLHDFGPDDFVERLDVYCTSLREEAGLSELGMFNNQQQILKSLRNRLLVEDLVARHPEILDVEIRAPIVICGLPRTGTTHLHNLDVGRPGVCGRSPYWESLEPVLAPAEQPAPGEPDPRIARTQMGLDFMHAAMPYFDRMHEMTVDHVHEEIQLLLIDFSTMLMETSVYVPSWAAYYKAHDQTSSYRYMKKVLQCCQFLRGGERWVLKSPQHLEQFPVLARRVPRRDVRGHAPRPGVGDGVAGDDGRLRVAHERRPPRPRAGRRVLVGRGSRRCCGRACATATCCRPTGRSTCASTSSWPTTWARSSASTTSRASR